MKNLTIEDVVREHVHLPIKSDHNGWYRVLCKVCNDHGRKGKRAGFKFGNNTVGYNCFNCGQTAVYDPSTHGAVMPAEMEKVLAAYSIPKTDWQGVLFQEFANPTTHKKRTKLAELTEPAIVTLPPYFTKLVDDEDDINQYAIEYLLRERGINWTEYPFYIGRHTNDKLSKRWYARLVIPIYKNGNLIFYQGRDLTGTRVKKYISADVPKAAVLYGYDEINRDTEDPLYVVEGWFDAYLLKGVAVFGSKMTADQVAILKRCRRPKVVIPDKVGDGHLLAEQAISMGWAVSTPDTGSCKDVDEAIQKYGIIYTTLSIKANTSIDAVDAATKVNMYCKEKKNG